MMSHNQLELFAAAVLKVLDANNTQFGLTTPAIRLMVRQFGSIRLRRKRSMRWNTWRGRDSWGKRPKCW
jgi:hypothetical protein